MTKSIVGYAAILVAAAATVATSYPTWRPTVTSVPGRYTFRTLSVDEPVSMAEGVFSLNDKAAQDVRYPAAVEVLARVRSVPPHDPLRVRLQASVLAPCVTDTGSNSVETVDLDSRRTEAETTLNVTVDIRRSCAKGRSCECPFRVVVHRAVGDGVVEATLQARPNVWLMHDPEKTGALAEAVFRN